MITDECINCGACEPECPNHAIYEGGAEWRYSDGTTLTGMITTLDGNEIIADNAFEPVNMDVYYITHDKCTECVGFHDEPQCAAVCPVDCCVDDPDYRESEDELLAKKSFLILQDGNVAKVRGCSGAIRVAYPSFFAHKILARSNSPPHTLPHSHSNSHSR